MYPYVTQPCLHTLVQPRLSANQSARTILYNGDYFYFLFAFIGQACFDFVKPVRLDGLIHAANREPTRHYSGLNWLHLKTLPFKVRDFFSRIHFKSKVESNYAQSDARSDAFAHWSLPQFEAVLSCKSLTNINTKFLSPERSNANKLSSEAIFGKISFSIDVGFSCAKEI